MRAVDDFSFSGVNDTLTGRCFDLKSAYRQLPIHLQDLPFAAVAVWSPSDKTVRVLQMFALPFGAGGSVPGFVRVALALWRILCRRLLVPATLFFDDFTCMVMAADADSAEASVHLLFRILGWRLALEGDKAKPFAQLFQSLGVCFCLQPDVDHCLSSVSNTEVRKAEVCRLVLRQTQVVGGHPQGVRAVC